VAQSRVGLRRTGRLTWALDRTLYFQISMKQVIVFGAGASVGFGVPTMDRFIDTADDLRAMPGSLVTQADFELFFDVLQNRFRQLHAKSTVNLDNIESVFGLIEMARLLGRLPGFDLVQIEELASAIRTVLVETVQLSGKFNYSEEERWSPPPDYLAVAAHIDHEIERRGDDIALISFNYDLGMDFALHWSRLPIDYGLGQPTRDAVRLFKLHGSLNWVTCRKCGAVRAILMDRIIKAHAGPRSLQSKSVMLSLDPRRAHDTIGPHCPGDDRPYEITIVPPSWNKTQYWKQLSNVWSAAAQELAAAQEITLIGYSLPETDSFFRDLMALGLEGPTRVRSFTVVNPDPDVAVRFERLLGPEVRRRFHAKVQTFEDWIRETYGANPQVHFL
jgi:hypothetical protein